MNRIILNLALVMPIVFGCAGIRAEDHVLHTFVRQQLTDAYFSEGAAVADINRDGMTDVIYGPHWYAGPDFKTGREIYAAMMQPRSGYADNFFTWPYDFNRDGWTDVLVAGLPGTPAYLYEHPGGPNPAAPWKKHTVFDFVGNESPHFTNITGDEKPELVCSRKGVFGYAAPHWEKPFETWEFHAVSGNITAERFGHGLGTGDVNGDGLTDILHTGGWIEQPGRTDSSGPWKQHPATLSNSYGGAEMYVYDVDGDGDNDVITSTAAHDFGLAWYEQVLDSDRRSFREHVIMGARPDQNRYGVVFSELHSVNLTDIDGDGLKDIVTGKTYYSHHEKSPQWDAGAVVYWFKLVRNPDGVDWVPFKADSDSGIGRQITVADINGDKLPDIVVGGMKGGNVLIHQRKSVSHSEWDAARPKPQKTAAVRTDRGQPAVFDEATGKVSGAIEAESMKVLRVSAGNAGPQNMAGFKKGRWSGGSQLFWSGATPRARLDLEFEIPADGTFDVETHFTTARDYAIINVLLDSKALGEPLDLFDYPDVGTTGALKLDRRTLKAGKHTITLETIGVNDSAVKNYMVGFDYLRLVPR